MQSLNNNSLAQISTQVSRPNLRRQDLKAGIAHIGFGAFHRAHQAAYTEDFMAKSQNYNWGIVGISLLDQDAPLQAALANQDFLYSLVQRDSEHDYSRIIVSVKDFLLRKNQATEIINCLASENIKLITLTITEGGYAFNQGTGELDLKDPVIAHDLQNPESPIGTYGTLLKALKIRKSKNLRPPTIMSCDNIQGNGKLLKKMLVAFAQQNSPEMSKWIESEIAFPCTMVDRITPAVTDASRALVATQYGYQDASPILCESFRQWVIEDNFCNDRPAWEMVGAQLVKEVAPYEMMKLRLLNAGHSSLGYSGYLCGFRTIHETTVDSDFNQYYRNLMKLEVIDHLDPVPGINLNDYQNSLVQRFSNHKIGDQSLRICMDGSTKIPKFVLPSISDAIKAGKSFSRLALIVAAWARFLQGQDEQGQAIPIVDPQAKRLQELATSDLKSPAALLKQDDIFGDLSESSIFLNEVTKAFNSLITVGARKTIQLYK